MEAQASKNDHNSDEENSEKDDVENAEGDEVSNESDDESNEVDDKHSDNGEADEVVDVTAERNKITGKDKIAPIKTPDQVSGEIFDDNENDKQRLEEKNQPEEEMIVDYRERGGKKQPDSLAEFRTRFDGVKVKFVTRDTQTDVDDFSTLAWNGGDAKSLLVKQANIQEIAAIDGEQNRDDTKTQYIGDGNAANEGEVESSLAVKEGQNITNDRSADKQSIEQTTGIEATAEQDELYDQFDADQELIFDDDEFMDDEDYYDDEIGADGSSTIVTDDSWGGVGVPPLRNLSTAYADIDQVGPPRILRRQRESRQKPITFTPLTDREMDEGVFAGQCDFCGREIKPYPDAEAQLYKHPREIFCCDDYQLFMQFALSKPFGNKYDVDVQKFVTAYMDIQPHAPYNKQARNIAKERAALRMREREVARQKKVVSQYQQQSQQQQQQSQAPQQQMYQQAAQRALKVINFSLGSKKCAEQGFIVDPVDERETAVSKLGRHGAVTVETLDNQQIGLETARIPNKGPIQKYYLDNPKQLFYVLFKDGSGTVFYPSGRPCILILSTPKIKPPDPFAVANATGKKSKPQSRTTNSRRAATNDNKSQRSGITATTNLTTAGQAGTAVTDPGYMGGFDTATATAVGGPLSEAGRTVRTDEDGPGSKRRQFLVFTDEVKGKLLAVFMPDGNAACYYENRQLRLHLDPFGGIVFGENLSKKRKWSWLDFHDNHQHAPPLQPLALALSGQVSLRIANQNAISLAYRSGQHTVKFNVGVKLKISAGKAALPKLFERTEDVVYLSEMQTYTHAKDLSKTQEVLLFQITAGKAALPKLFERTEDVVYLSEMQTYTQTIVNRIHNLLKYRNEELAERLPPPPYLAHQVDRRGISNNLAKLTGRVKKEASVDRSNKTPSPEKLSQQAASQDENVNKSVAVAS